MVLNLMIGGPAVDCAALRDRARKVTKRTQQAKAVLPVNNATWCRCLSVSGDGDPRPTREHDERRHCSSISDEGHSRPSEVPGVKGGPASHDPRQDAMEYPSPQQGFRQGNL